MKAPSRYWYKLSNFLPKFLQYGDGRAWRLWPHISSESWVWDVSKIVKCYYWACHVVTLHAWALVLNMRNHDHMANMSVHHPDNVSVFEMILFFMPSETKVRYAFIVKNDLMTRVCQQRHRSASNAKVSGWVRMHQTGPPVHKGSDSLIFS